MAAGCDDAQTIDTLAAEACAEPLANPTRMLQVLHGLSKRSHISR